MVLLAVETSSTTGSLAVFTQDQDHLIAKRAYRFWEKSKSHSEVITTKLTEVLEESGFRLSDLTHLAVGQGPGSFTGLRVGINLVRTLGYAQNLPVLPVSSLEVLAAPALEKYPDMPVLVITNAFRNLMYAASFTTSAADGAKLIWGPEALNAETLEERIQSAHICVGDGFGIFGSMFSDRLRSYLIRDNSLLDIPSAQDLGLIATGPNKKSEFLSWKLIKPLYIRGSEAEEKLRRGLLKPIREI